MELGEASRSMKGGADIGGSIGGTAHLGVGESGS